MRGYGVPLSRFARVKATPKRAKQILATGLTLLLAITPIVSGLLFLLADNFCFGRRGRSSVASYLQYLAYPNWRKCFYLWALIAMPFLLRNDDSLNLATILIRRWCGDQYCIGLPVYRSNEARSWRVLRWQLQWLSLGNRSSGLLFSRRANCVCWNELRLKLFRYSWNLRHWQASSFFLCMRMVRWWWRRDSALFSQYGDQLMIGAYAILGYIVTVYYLTAKASLTAQLEELQPMVLAIKRIFVSYWRLRWWALSWLVAFRVTAECVPTWVCFCL